MLFTNTDCLCFAKDPAVVRYRSRYWLYYSLRHEDGRFGIGIAESADMEHWTPCGEIEQDALCETNGIAAPPTAHLRSSEQSRWGRRSSTQTAT